MLLTNTQVLRLCKPLLKTVLPLIKNVLKPLSKSVLIPLGLAAAAASAADATSHNNMFASGMKTLITSKEEINDILKKSGLLIEGVSEKIKHKAKE